MKCKTMKHGNIGLQCMMLVFIWQSVLVAAKIAKTIHQRLMIRICQ